jgi:electron transfer flavoprotein alpha subunit
VETILLLANTEAGGTLAKPALEALTAALQLGGEVVVGLAGAETQAAANQIASCGASRILAVTGEAFAQAR